MEVLRLKKARRWLWALATTKDYEHAPVESLVSVMHATRAPCVVELVLTPAPVLLDRYAGRALRGRERSLKLEGWLLAAGAGCAERRRAEASEGRLGGGRSCVVVV